MFGVRTITVSNILNMKSWKDGADHSCRTVGENGDIK